MRATGRLNTLHDVLIVRGTGSMTKKAMSASAVRRGTIGEGSSAARDGMNSNSQPRSGQPPAGPSSTHPNLESCEDDRTLPATRKEWSSALGDLKDQDEARLWRERLGAARRPRMRTTERCTRGRSSAARHATGANADGQTAVGCSPSSCVRTRAARQHRGRTDVATTPMRCLRVRRNFGCLRLRQLHDMR